MRPERAIIDPAPSRGRVSLSPPPRSARAASRSEGGSASPTNKETQLPAPGGRGQPATAAPTVAFQNESLSRRVAGSLSRASAESSREIIVPLLNSCSAGFPHRCHTDRASPHRPALLPGTRAFPEGFPPKSRWIEAIQALSNPGHRLCSSGSAPGIWSWIQSVPWKQCFESHAKQGG